MSTRIINVITSVLKIVECNIEISISYKNPSREVSYSGTAETPTHEASAAQPNQPGHQATTPTTTVNTRRAGRLATLVRPSPTGLRPAAARTSHGKQAAPPPAFPAARPDRTAGGGCRASRPRLPDRTSGLRLKMQGGVSGFRKSLLPPP